LEWEDDIRTQNCSQNKIKQQLKTPFLMVVLTLIKIGGSSQAQNNCYGKKRQNFNGFLS
jgi:hypothetical protein